MKMSEAAMIVVFLLTFVAGGFGGFYLAMFKFRNWLNGRLDSIFERLRAVELQIATIQSPRAPES